MGVDVSKRTLDLSDALGGRVETLANEPAVWARLARRWRSGVVVGVEPSGGYEKGLVRALTDAGVDVRWADPGRVRALARALGAPAKTDAIDAAMIARFVAQTGGRKVERDLEREALRELLDARLAAQDTAQRLKAQAGALQRGPARRELEALACAAMAAVKRLTAAVMTFLRRSETLRAFWRRLQSAPGVGPLVAADMLAFMPELGRVDQKVIAKLAGLAPFIRQSGQWKGRATCSGGRPRPRRALFLAAMAAIRTRAPLRGLYEALIARGKPRMVALNACMRRLLVALNAMTRDQSTWQTH